MNSIFCSHLVHLAPYWKGHHWNIENIVNKFAALFAKRHSNTIATHTNTKIKILPHSRAQKHKPFQHPPLLTRKTKHPRLFSDPRAASALVSNGSKHVAVQTPQKADAAARVQQLRRWHRCRRPDGRGRRRAAAGVDHQQCTAAAHQGEAETAAVRGETEEAVTAEFWPWG